MNGEIFEEILESMAVAVLVLDRAGEVAFANRAARALKGCGLTVDGWKLKEWVRCSRGSVQMKRAGCGESLAHVSSRMIGDCRVIFIWIFPRDRQGVQRILMDLYALTPQEARLAVELCFSTSLADVARDLCIAMDTARTHLKRVFSKTDTKKQSQLVLLVATCAVALPHESRVEATDIRGGARPKDLSAA
jgi:DNA-binding CsgD family transcriptional regulator